MNITVLGYVINLEIVLLCIVLYLIIVFNIMYSTIRLQGFKELYELMGISVEEGFEVLKETTQKLKQMKLDKLKQESKEQEKSQQPQRAKNM